MSLKNKVGLVTFHRVMNIGAVLQAVATYQYLSRFSDCEVVDYVPNNLLPIKTSYLHRFLHFIKSCIFLASTINEYRKKQKFSRFLSSHTKISDYTIWGDCSAKQMQWCYDIMVSGSDQILNTELTGNSEMYYLKFFSGKKVSFASSFGRETVSSAEKGLIKNELKLFDKLSCREASAVSIVYENTGIRPSLVLDPCFLLSEYEWRKYESQSIHRHDYILVYAMESSEELKSVIRYAIDTYKLKVYLIKGCHMPNIKKTHTLRCVGPADFLFLVDNANLIITNSFHGTAFSVVFKKKLMCIAHSCKNTRLVNLLRIIHKDTQMVFPNTYDYGECVIDCSKLDQNIDEYREFSRQYLLDAIEGLQ